MAAIKAKDLVRLIGRRIREIRRERRWGQVDLAEHSHVKQAQISLIETAERGVSIPTLLEIAEALEVEPAILFLDPNKNQRHQVAIAVLNCSERTLAAIAKLVDLR